MQRLKDLLGKNFKGLTDLLKIPSDWVEAMTFAYLAYKNIQKQPLDLRNITGSNSSNCILGTLHEVI